MGLNLARWIVVLFGAVSTLAFARDGFHFFLHGLINTLFLHLEWWIEIILFPLKRIIETFLLPILAMALRNFGINISISVAPHWHHVFILMWVYFGSIARATIDYGGVGDRQFRFVSGFLCALLASIMAGTYSIDGNGVLLWPLAGFFMYQALNRAWGVLLFKLRGSGIKHFGWQGITQAAFVVVLATTSVALGYSTFGEAWSPSAGITILAGLVLASSIILVVLGTISQQRTQNTYSSSAENFNTARRAGLEMIYIFGVAAAAIGVDRAQDLLAAGKFEPLPSPGASFSDCSECPTMLVLPGGNFQFGEDRPPRSPWDSNTAYENALEGPRAQSQGKVNSFAMGKTEVTVAQWEAFERETNYYAGRRCGFSAIPVPGQQASVTFLQEDWFSPEDWRNPGFSQSADHPVVCITWWEAKAYVAWLSAKTGRNYRLPTDAEWEYAARAGSKQKLPETIKSKDVCTFANLNDASGFRVLRSSIGGIVDCDDRVVFTASVSDPRFPPNAFGFTHMIGNVWEWIEDCESLGLQSLPHDGGALYTDYCDQRMRRGGSFVSTENRVGGIGESNKSTRTKSDQGLRVVATAN